MHALDHSIHCRPSPNGTTKAESRGHSLLFKIKYLCLVVAILDIVHDVRAIFHHP